MDSITMTQEELENLKIELGELETAGRAEIAARIKTARGWGDLKENGEYHAAKEAQAHLETNILRLRHQVLVAEIVDQAPSGDTVQHGSTVSFTDVARNSGTTYKIVAPRDAKPGEGSLSSSSPVAQALIGHQVGETVDVRSPSGTRQLRIDSIT
jgi:transcription elongation factor GreA